MRVAASLLLLWTLLVAPALCMGGVLEHACDCASEVSCEDEDTCADDPCPTVATATDADGFRLASSMPAPLRWDVGVAFGVAEGRDPGEPPPRGWARMPCAPSDRPLRL